MQGFFVSEYDSLSYLFWFKRDCKNTDCLGKEWQSYKFGYKTSHQVPFLSNEEKSIDKCYGSGSNHVFLTNVSVGFITPKCGVLNYLLAVGLGVNFFFIDRWHLFNSDHSNLDCICAFLRF